MGNSSILTPVCMSRSSIRFSNWDFESFESLSQLPSLSGNRCCTQAPPTPSPYWFAQNSVIWKLKISFWEKKKEKKKLKEQQFQWRNMYIFWKWIVQFCAHTSTLWTRHMTRATVKQQQVQLQQQSHHSDWFRNRTSPACRCLFPFVISTVFFIFSMSQMSTIFHFDFPDL